MKIKHLREIPTGFSLWGVKYRWGIKMSWFATNNSLSAYLRNNTR